MAAAIVASLRSRDKIFQKPKGKILRSVFEIAEIADALSGSKNKGGLISNKTFEVFEYLPLTANIPTERASTGDLFLEEIILKADDATKGDAFPYPWMVSKARLCREHIYLSSAYSMSESENELVMEDLPLLLIENIAMAFVNSSSDGKLFEVTAARKTNISLRDERGFANETSTNFSRRILKILGFRWNKQLEDYERKMTVENPPWHLLRDQNNPKPEAETTFLRLSIIFSGSSEERRWTDGGHTLRMPGRKISDLLGKHPTRACILSERDAVDPASWHWLGQTEWAQDSKALTSLDVRLPRPDAVWRLTVIDVDDPSNLPTCFDPHTRHTGLVGVTELSGADILAAVGASLTAVLGPQHCHGPGGEAADPIGGTTLATPRPPIHLSDPWASISVRVEEVRESGPSCLVICTRAAGSYAERQHALLFATERARNLWAGGLRLAIARARRDDRLARGALRAWQPGALRLYNHPAIQGEPRRILNSRWQRDREIRLHLVAGVARSEIVSFSQPRTSPLPCWNPGFPLRPPLSSPRPPSPSVHPAEAHLRGRQC